MPFKFMRILSFCLFMLSLYGFNLFAQFEMRSPDFQSTLINDLFFLNSNTGFFVNGHGSIYMTSDGGATWKLKAHLQRDYITEITFVDEQYGFAISPVSYMNDSDDFLFTTNGGLNWTNRFLNITDAITFMPISISQILKANNDGLISKLNNFFGEWQVKYKMKTFIAGDFLSSYGTVNKFLRLNNNRIIALGNSWKAKNSGLLSDSIAFLLKSDDDGESWDTLWCGLSDEIFSLSFANENTAWMGSSSNKIFKSIDGGRNWTLQYFDALVYSKINSIWAIDSLNVFCITNYGKLIFSSNGGESWQTNQFLPEPPSERDFKVKFLNRDKGFIYGIDLFVTKDGGISWGRVSKSVLANFRKIDFVNEHLGWAVGEKFIFNTTDGGYTWAVQFNPPDEHIINGIDMIDSLNGWATGYKTVYRTTNGGKAWLETLINPIITFIRGIHFYNDKLGIIFEVHENYSSDTTINYVTTNGGISWNRYPIKNMKFVSSYSKVKWTDQAHLWFTNQQGLWLSKDSGKTWQVNPRFSTFLSQFDFSDSLNGWIVGNINEKKVYYTTDGCLTWSSATLNYFIQATDLSIIGKNYFGESDVIISGLYGDILSYQKWNNSFRTEKSFTRNNFFSISTFKKGNIVHYWIAGDGGTILYSQRLVTDMKDGYIVPNESLLYQNYPNPFNSISNFKFQIAKSGHVTIKIYDLLGRELTKIVDEIKPPGVYQVQFDASRLASGTYYYRMNIGNYSEIKKFTVLK